MVFEVTLSINGYLEKLIFLAVMFSLKEIIYLRLFKGID